MRMRPPKSERTDRRSGDDKSLSNRICVVKRSLWIDRIENFDRFEGWNCACLKPSKRWAALMSFKRAGEVLHCTQSTVSAQIKALEDDLRTPLFLRLGRRIVLTAAGEALLTHSPPPAGLREGNLRPRCARSRRSADFCRCAFRKAWPDFHLPVILARFPRPPSEGRLRYLQLRLFPLSRRNARRADRRGLSFGRWPAYPRAGANRAGARSPGLRRPSRLAAGRAPRAGRGRSGRRYAAFCPSTIAAIAWSWSARWPNPGWSIRP